MIKNQFITSSQADYEFLINILLLGILTVLSHEKISIDESQRLIFRYGVASVLDGFPIDKYYSKIVFLGMELDDIKDIVPHKYNNELDKLIKLTLDRFNETCLSRNIYWEQSFVKGEDCVY